MDQRVTSRVLSLWSRFNHKSRYGSKDP